MAEWHNTLQANIREMEYYIKGMFWPIGATISSKNRMVLSPTKFLKCFLMAGDELRAKMISNLINWMFCPPCIICITLDVIFEL